MRQPQRPILGSSYRNACGCRVGAWIALALLGSIRFAIGDEPADPIAARFTADVLPLLKSHCFRCHANDKHEADLNLAAFDSARAVAENPRVWQLVKLRLAAQEMPPEDAPASLADDQRQTLIDWIADAQRIEAERNEGDPGPVLARRLSNAEFDYSIRDLTGIDIRPAAEFPVDPANEAGFDNSGESLSMSAALLQKYLAAARRVAEHVVFTPRGFVFAPHPVVTETDRDKYCVQRIIAFYDRSRVDYADYLLAAWRFRFRESLGEGARDLPEVAAAARLSPKYLATIWSVLNDPVEEAGPLAAVRSLWRELPAPGDDRAAAVAQARMGCEQIRELIVRLRGEMPAEAGKLHVDGISDGSQPLVLARNRESASLHTRYSGNVVEDAPRLAAICKETDASVAAHFDLAAADSAAIARHQGAYERFCRDFPRAFVVSDRGPYFDPKQAGQGRLLTAGFHLMQGYFRDDRPLYELVLDEAGQALLDALWQELNFITEAPIRQYKDFIFFERAEPPRFMREATFDFARSEDKDSTSPEKMKRLAELHLAKARRIGASDAAVQAIADYYSMIEADIRQVERERTAAEPLHVADLVTFAARAWRRPLTSDEQEALRNFYKSLREQDGLGHEEAIRDALASVLVSPRFCFRVAGPTAGTEPQPLDDDDLASRLSYFLWSSLPDDALLAQAASGRLHETETLLAQTRRMLRDEKVRGLATEFGGNWLDFRRFEEHNSVDRERFPTFTPELRRAMFEEPIRFFVDLLHNNGSVDEFLLADYTFVNAALARHYGIPMPGEAAPESWVRIAAARQYGRGGILPMAVFQTRYSPGLRTSPVKRGNWVVRRLLGEYIPAPPPAVPELPKDEADLGELTLPQLLERHRADKNCAACHRRFDSIGLAFEGFGPIGERRTVDLGGRPVEDAVEFPDGAKAAGMEGLRRYLRERRQAEFVDNFCRKLCVYALGRTLLLSDEKLIATMKERLAADGGALHGAVEAIVLSKQFRYQRGRDDSRKP